MILAQHDRNNYQKIMILRILVINVLVFVLQYTGLMLTTIATNTSPLWFAAGTATAFTFLRGITVLPGIWLGSFCAFYFAHAGLRIAVNFAGLFTLQSYLLLTICYFCLIPTLIFYQLRSLVKFMLIALSVTGIVSLIMAGSGVFWLRAWLANFIGVVIFGMGLLTWDAYFPQAKINKMHILLFLGFCGLIIFSLCSPYFFVTAAAIIILSLSFSYYFGWCGAVAITFALGLLLGLGAYLALPVYQHTPIIFLQAFLLSCLALNLIIGTAINERWLRGLTTNAR